MNSPVPAGPRLARVSRRLGSRRANWARDVMPSFLNTLPRWYSTVLGLMNRLFGDLVVGRAVGGELAGWLLAGRGPPVPAFSLGRRFAA